MIYATLTKLINYLTIPQITRQTSMNVLTIHVRGTRNVLTVQAGLNANAPPGTRMRDRRTANVWTSMSVADRMLAELTLNVLTYQDRTYASVRQASLARAMCFAKVCALN